jgi:hypothetical protein
MTFGGKDMTKRIAISVAFAGLSVTFAWASQLVPFELSKLSSTSEIVVVARVAKVTPVELDSRKPTPFDQVELIVATVLKGSLQKSKLTIVLEPRGVRDFDPSLKPGDSGVFFLRKNSNQQFRPITAGAVAMFENKNFVVTEDKISEQSPGGDSLKAAPQE